MTVSGTRTSEVLSKLTRNGEPVSPKDVEIAVKEDKIVITFRKPTRESSGPYEFGLSNSQGETKTPLKINFVDVPSPPEGPLEVYDVYKDSCKLSWKPPKDTGGLPLLHYVVERQDLGVRGGWTEVGTTENCKINVKDLVHKKEYKFRVRAVNKKGASEPLNAPKTTLARDPYDEPGKPKDVEVVDWDRDHVDLKWKAPDKDGGDPIEKYIVEAKDKFSPDWVSVLEVPGDQLKGKVTAVKENMQYQFRVRAVNRGGIGEPSDPTKNILVKARFVKPFIIGDDLKNIVIKKGAIIKYDIQFGGEPAPEVKWDINSNEIKPSSRISIENTAKSTLLVIKQAVRGDSGKFRLTLTNSSGSVSAEADVVVLDKPTPPGGPLVLEDVCAESAKIKWKKPKDTGGSELKGYLIEKMDMDSGRWVPCGEVGPQAESFKCEGLTKGKKYKFRVKALNKEGESDPLELDQPFVAKNPYDEPSKPGKPEIVDYDNTRVDLKWTPPAKDGGKPIEKYIVEMKDKFSNEWKEVLKTDSPKCEATVPNLKENSSVQFRVRAVNLAGPSEPSDATETHIVKHRNLKPYIDRTNLKNITIKAGRSHKYEVDIRGEPPPTVTWTFGEAKLSDDNHIKIENKDYHSDISITKATRKQSGKYTITATNRSGSDSVVVELTVLASPSKPEGPLEVTDIHKEGCKLKWKKPKDDGGTPVKEYEVEKFDKETGRWTRCGKTDKPEFDVTGLTPGKEYLFRVTAINDEGESEPLTTLEPIIAKNPYDEPSKPGTPEIVDYDNVSVDLKWEKPKSDGGAPIQKYIIEKKEKLAFNWEKAAEVPGNITEGKVVDLKERTEVQFRIIAVNKAGPSEPSDATKIHVVKYRRLKPYIDRTNLDMVTIKKGKQLKLDVNVRGEPPPTITWKLLDNIVRNDEHYEIVNVDYNTKFTINDCQRKHTGKYKIIAVNEVGKDEAEVEICVLAAPSKPKGPIVVTEVHAKGCKLQWQKPDDDGGKPIQGYAVEKLDPLTGNWVPCGRTDKDSTSFEVTGLTPGKFYQFRVKAINAEGESEPLVTTDPVLAKNPYEAAGPPGLPEIADWDEKHVDLKWTPPKKDGGAPITGYVVEMKEKSSSNWEPVLETNSPKPEAKVEGLEKGKQYQFRIKAVNKAGPGEPSEPTKPHIAKERFLAPKINRENLQPITIKAGNTAKLDVEVSGEPPPKITWSFAGKPVENDTNIKIENPDYESHIQMKNMTRAQSGKYKITAQNDSGKDEAEVEINVLDRPGKPEGPLNVENVHANGCTLGWRPPKDDGGVPIQNYVIEKKDTATGRWVPVAKVPADKTEADITGLDAGKRYEFRVKAVNDEGDSEPLETDRSTLAKNPFDEPGPPGMPVIDDYDKDFVQLKWEPPVRDGGAPITGYIIEKKDKYAKDFVPAAEIHGNICQGKVTGLNEGDKYEFRVRAVNKAGPGAPSEATAPHLAKPRFLAPKIDRTNLRPITVKVGQMVNFDVDVIGEPPPKIVWKFNGQELSSGDIYLIDNIDYNTKFNLMRATRKENGVYTITATNSSGTDEATVEVNVLGKPSKPNGPLEVSDVHKEGCKLKWKPPDDDGGAPIECYEVEKMDEETGRWVPAGKSKETSIEVSNLIPGKKYKFRVRAVNKEGDSDELETDHSTVAKNPFDEPGKPGRPEPTDWDKDHVDLKWTPPESDGGAPITGYIIEKRKKGTHKWQKAKTLLTPDTNATVPDLEEGEEYEFRVMAVNKAGPSEPSDASRSVIAKPRRLAPIIDRTNLKNITIRSGQPVKFDVDVKGEPPPTIEWSFKGDKLKDDETHKIENEPNHTLFILSKSKRSDTGSYVITARNEHGTDEATVEIKVLSKPGKPKGPLKISDVHAEGCKLKWDKPEDDGGEPITNYLIEKMDTETGRWVPVATTREPEADITGLIPGKEYKFRVKAVNPEGESEPLEADLPIVAKNPFDEPGKPGKPSAKDWDKHHVDLVWKPPDSDGGAPITSYIIEKKDKYSTKWQKAAEIIGDKCEARVPDLIEGMEYQFRVKAVNKAGPGTPSDASDSVTAKPRNLAPKIDRSSLKDIVLHAGQSLKFDVKVIGEPPPKTLWFANDVPIKDGAHYSVDNEPYRTKLSVNTAERKDTGVYKITAENPSGKDEAFVNVTVLDKPSPPEGPLDISDVHAEGCKLKWKEPKDDGGVPIESYVIEKQDTQTGR
jgi:predicted phage tail protein